MEGGASIASSAGSSSGAIIPPYVPKCPTTCTPGVLAPSRARSRATAPGSSTRGTVLGMGSQPMRCRPRGASGRSSRSQAGVET